MASTEDAVDDTHAASARRGSRVSGGWAAGCGWVAAAAAAAAAVASSTTVTAVVVLAGAAVGVAAAAAAAAATVVARAPPLGSRDIRLVCMGEEGIRGWHEVVTVWLEVVRRAVGQDRPG